MLLENLYEKIKEFNEEKNIELDESKCTSTSISFSKKKRTYIIWMTKGGFGHAIEFRENDKRVNWGEVIIAGDIIASYHDWITFLDFNLLVEKYNFIANHEKRLQEIHSSLIKSQGSLSTLPFNISARLDFFKPNPSYNISNGDYSIQLLSKKLNDSLEFRFDWNGSKIFTYKNNDISQMALIIKNWLIDKDIPSKIELNFPIIVKTELAPFIDRGEGLIGQNVQSWNWLISYYEQMYEHHQYMTSIPLFIQCMKTMIDKGYHRKLRVSQSLLSMVVVLNDKHSNRKTKKRMILFFDYDSDRLHVSPLHDVLPLMTSKIELTEELDDFLSNYFFTDAEYIDLLPDSTIWKFNEEKKYVADFSKMTQVGILQYLKRQLIEKNGVLKNILHLIKSPDLSEEERMNYIEIFENNLEGYTSLHKELDDYLVNKK